MFVLISSSRKIPYFEIFQLIIGVMLSAVVVMLAKVVEALSAAPEVVAPKL